MFRKATVDDIEAISEIYDDIHLEIEKGKLGTGWVRDTYPTRKTIEDSIARGDMFVGQDEEEVVSAAIINQIQGEEYSGASWNYDVGEKDVMVLHTLVVSPTRSGKGYGTKFIKFYEEYALESGCNYLRMDTNEKNLNARRLYKNLGYTEAAIVSTVFNGIEGVKLVLLEKKIK